MEIREKLGKMREKLGKIRENFPHFPGATFWGHFGEFLACSGNIGEFQEIPGHVRKFTGIGSDILGEF